MNKSFYILLVGLSLVFAKPVLADNFQKAQKYHNEKNYEAAISLLTPLADNGHVPGQSLLGQIYGYAPYQEMQKAKHYLLSAANAGNADAAWHIGLVFMYQLEAEEIIGGLDSTEWHLLAVKLGSQEAKADFCGFFCMQNP